MTLKVKAARSSMFMAAMTVGVRPIVMLLNIITARLLGPDAFGLIAMAMIVVGVSNLVTDMGMRTALVQTKLDIKKAAHYAFLIVMAGSLLVTGLIILFAVPLANLLGGGAPLVPILRVISIYVTLDGLWIVPGALLQREMRFRQLSIAQIPAEVAFTAIAIPLAFMGFGVWSLVIGRLCAVTLRGILVWSFYRPWIWLRPQRWEKESVRSLVSFGARSTSSAMLRYFQTQYDTWFVGRHLGTIQVGYYSKAYDLTTRISDMMTSAIFGFVMYPFYAKVQDDRARLARAYLKSTAMVFFMIVPVSIGMAVTASLTIKVLLGNQWLPMIPIWQVFSLYGLTRPISTNSSPVFLATNSPQRNATASLVLLAVMIPLIFLLSGPYGAVGVALAVAVGYVVTMFFNIYQVNTILPGTASKTLLQSLPSLVAGVIMAAGILVLEPFIFRLTGGENIMALIAVILLGAVIYGLVTFVLQRALILELYELVVQATGLDKRWPRLLPQRLRTRKQGEIPEKPVDSLETR